MGKQDELFELAWQKEWQDMPEFVQEKQEPYPKLVRGINSKKRYVNES